MQILIDIDENVFTRLFDNGIEDYEIVNDDLFAIAKAIRKGTVLENKITSTNLCNSCTNIGCEFQSGIVRTKCAFYIPPHIEPDNCGNYVVMQPTVEDTPKDQYEARLKADMVAILDKIRAEILLRDKNVKDVRTDGHCFFTAEEILEIIDKYKAESEGNMNEVGVEIVKTEEAEENGIKYLNINVSNSEVERNPDIVRLCADAEILEYVKPKTGRWVLTQRGRYIDISCSECGNTRFKEYSCGYTVDELNDLLAKVQMNYCECCGAKMQEVEE